MMKSYTTQDKTGWGDGPWQDEPDKMSWTDDTTGLPCLITRPNLMGALCGYVGVERDHTWHGVEYDEYLYEHNSTPEDLIDVHGGLTYSGPHDEGQGHDLWWFGFDCCHYLDVSPAGKYAPIPGSEYRDIGYVQAEVARLASQLADIDAASWV